MNLKKKQLKSAFRSRFEDRFYIFAAIALLLLIIEFFIPETSRKRKKKQEVL